MAVFYKRIWRSQKREIDVKRECGVAGMEDYPVPACLYHQNSAMITRCSKIFF